MSAPLNPPFGLVELKCPNCGAGLAPADVSTHLQAARCRHCNTLFAIQGSAATPIPRPELSLPPSFTIERTMDAITLTRKWRGWQTLALLVFTAFWNGFLIVWHTLALRSGQFAMSAFGSIHTGVGLFLAYMVIAQLFNSTKIRATSFQIDVRHGPLPWRGNRSLPTQEIIQLFCREKVSHNRNGSNSSYCVEAVLRNQQRTTLVTGLPKPEHAQFIEQELEKFLNLADRPVAGEFGR